MAELALMPAVQTVPADRSARVRMRAQVREWAQRARLVPPLDLDELRALALRAAAELDLDDAHVDFATVLIGNAAWEDALASVPPEQRLLLLPQCLRAQDTCEAPLDEIGLACLGCGSCAIAGLEAEAEALGTHVLVAEGTTAAARLVETGRVQGVIAVACLDSLERSFAASTAGGVPAVAIPLLDSGCRSTHVDLDWVREALRRRGAAGCLRPLDLDALRQTVRGWFDPSSVARLLQRERTATEDLACKAVASSGKRWRPTLTAAVWQALCEGDADPSEAVRRIAVAVECFHKASLVHDDIEDGDLERNGQPALHVACGTPVALNVGDLLVGEGYRLIAEAGLAPATTATMVATVARAQRELCLGQGEELAWTRELRVLTRAEALSLLRRKTAPAFEVGLLLGAMAAGADDATCRALRELSAGLGLAYQIRDDLDDAGAARCGASSSSPLVVALVAEQQGRPLAARLAAGQLSPTDHEALVETIAPEAWRLFDRHRVESLRALRPLSSQPLKALLFRLVSLFLGGRHDVRGRSQRPHATTPRPERPR